MVGLDTCASPSDTDLDLVGAGFSVPRPCRSATDLDLFFVKFPTLWLSGLGAGGFGSAPPTLALDFQMDPIFDWTILPLYVPGADLDDGTAAGGFGASAAIFLCFTACSVRKAWLCVCRCLVEKSRTELPNLDNFVLRGGGSIKTLKFLITRNTSGWSRKYLDDVI